MPNSSATSEMAGSAPTSTVKSGFPRGLRAEDFRRIAGGGFGDRNNRTAHSMAWFKDHLYVGTTRRSEDDPYSNRPASDSNARGQIWRFDPAANRWEQVYVCPLLRSRGREVPREVGYRSMIVLQGPSDREAALYVSTISDHGSLFLRSTDGRTFEVVSTPGLGRPVNRSFRALAKGAGGLYTSPAGRSGDEMIERNFADAALVYESSDPALGKWRVVSEPGFGDAGNIGVFELAAFNGHLYAGTFNPKAGCQIWKIAPGEASSRWTRVVSAGAQRGNLNEVAVSMTPFEGALFVGTGIPGLGYDRTHEVGPSTAELIRVNADGTWDLIVGETRDTIEGRKEPLSGFGAGFDNRFNSVIWRMVVHDGWLYAGTHDWSVFLTFFARRMHRPFGRLLHRKVQQEAGFDLWRTRDGVHWVQVTNNGFANPLSYGVRTLASTPVGLFVGTHSLGTAEDAAWGARPGDQRSGGLDVWWGRS